jgi:hypothetical protein
MLFAKQHEGANSARQSTNRRSASASLSRSSYRSVGWKKDGPPQGARLGVQLIGGGGEQFAGFGISPEHLQQATTAALRQKNIGASMIAVGQPASALSL